MVILWVIVGGVLLVLPFTLGALEAAYGAAYRLAGGDEFLLGTVGSWLIGACSYWLFNIVFILSDVYDWPGWMRKYKIQKDQNFPMDMAKYKNALRTSLFNTWVVSGVMALPLYWAQKARGISFSPLEVPSAGVIVRDLLISVGCVEFAFYHSHRLLHHPWLYRRVHKKHHEWTSPASIVAVYASLPEYLLGNIMPVMLGPLVARSHVSVAWLWLTIALFSTTVGHSGYHLPLLNPPELHDFHHYNFEGCYGSIGFFDWLYGTDAKFKKTIASKRRKILFGLTPADELFPSDQGPYKVDRTAD